MESLVTQKCSTIARFSTILVVHSIPNKELVIQKLSTNTRFSTILRSTNTRFYCTFSDGSYGKVAGMKYCRGGEGRSDEPD